MPRRAALALPLAALAALAPAPAAAEIVDAPFAPTFEQKLVGLDDFTYDSDWFPMDAPLQLRLIVHAGNSVKVSMPGVAHYDWDPQAIAFEGTPMAGELAFDVGLELDAKVRFDVAGIKWESDIIGPYDYAVISANPFTPYLLPGNPERPVMVMDETDPVTFVSVDIIPDILIAHGHLDIDVFIIITGSLACTAIEATVDDPAPDFAAVLEELAAAALNAGPGPLPSPLVVDGKVICDLATAPTIVLNPVLIMEILGKEYEVAGIEVPVDIPPFVDQVQVGPETMLFDRPPPPAGTTGTSGGESESGGDTDGGTASATGGADTAATDGSAGDSATTGLGSATGGFGGPGEEGCNCRSDAPTGPASAFALALLALTPRRRRRR